MYANDAVIITKEGLQKANIVRCKFEKYLFCESGDLPRLSVIFKVGITVY